MFYPESDRERYYNFVKPYNQSSLTCYYYLTDLEIKNVIFNAPATIIQWTDGTKTVVKCGKNDAFDPEKGLAMAIAKKVLGNRGNYYNEFKKWLPGEEVEQSPNITLIPLKDHVWQAAIEEAQKRLIEKIYFSRD